MSPDELISITEGLALEVSRLRKMRAELVKALETIAGGHTERFPGAPDVVEHVPVAFQAKMWSWSQEVARAAIEEDRR
jgi:sensor domain CHASE-containing protein